MKLELKYRTSLGYIDVSRLNVPVRLITWNSSSPHDNLPPGRMEWEVVGRLPFPERMMDNKHEDCDRARNEGTFFNLRLETPVSYWFGVKPR